MVTGIWWLRFVTIPTLPLEDVTCVRFCDSCKCFLSDSNFFHIKNVDKSKWVKNIIWFYEQDNLALTFLAVVDSSSE